MTSTRKGTRIKDWDPTRNILELINQNPVIIACVGLANSNHRRCTNKIAQRNVQEAKSLISRIFQPGINPARAKDLLLQLAKCTLCQRYHQGQAEELSERWYREILCSPRPAEAINEGANKAENKRAREAEDRRQRDQQEQARREAEAQRNEQARGNHQKTSPDEDQEAKRAEEAQHQANVRQTADQAHREETERQAAAKSERMRREAEEKKNKAAKAEQERLRREKAKAAEQERVRQEKAAKVERERLQREKAEKDRLRNEREARERNEQNAQQSWPSAWSRYEEACNPPIARFRHSTSGQRGLGFTPPATRMR